MGKFKIPTFSSTTNKTVRFPNNKIDRVIKLFREKRALILLPLLRTRKRLRKQNPIPIPNCLCLTITVMRLRLKRKFKSAP